MQDIRQEILEYLLKIPKGKVMTYKTLAEVFGVHPRKVAMTMKYNKYPDIYPCYKVVSHSGNIGGYSGEKGIEGKIERLKKEGIGIIDGKIGSKYIL